MLKIEKFAREWNREQNEIKHKFQEKRLKPTKKKNYHWNSATSVKSIQNTQRIELDKYVKTDESI